MLRVRTDGEGGDELRLLADGVRDAPILHHLVRDGTGVPGRVQEVEDEIVAARHHPPVAGVRDLEATLLARRWSIELAVDQLPDPLDAAREERIEVRRAVGLGAPQIGLGLHRDVVERATELLVDHRVRRPVRIHRRDDVDQRPHRRLRRPLGVLEQPGGQRRVAIDIVDQHHEPVGIEPEQDRVQHLTAGRGRERPDAVIMVIEREALTFEVDRRALAVPVEGDGLSLELGERHHGATADLDADQEVHFLPSRRTETVSSSQATRPEIQGPVIGPNTLRALPDERPVALARLFLAVAFSAKLLFALTSMAEVAKDQSPLRCPILMRKSNGPTIEC